MFSCYCIFYSCIPIIAAIPGMAITLCIPFKRNEMYVLSLYSVHNGNLPFEQIRPNLNLNTNPDPSRNPNPTDRNKISPLYLHVHETETR